MQKRKHTVNGGLFGINPFAKAFQEFDEDSFFSNLHHKVKNKSYFQQYKGFKNTILAASYLFNVASMLSASYAVFWLTQWLTGLIIVGYIIAAVFLFFLEKLKRKSSNEFFQVLFFRKEVAYGWLALSLFCMGISLASSAFGTKTGTEELSPDPELIAADSTATLYRQEIVKLEQQNQELSSQRNHEGTIYYKLQDAIRQNTAMIADYNVRILDLDKKLEGKNEQLTGKYQQQVKLTAWTLAITIILMEIIFELCIAYVWYFYYRCYVERQLIEGFPDDEQDLNLNTNTQDQHSPTLQQLTELISEINNHLKKAADSPKNVPVAPNYPESPKTSSNGISGLSGANPASSSCSNRPIGFYTERQLIKMGLSPTDGIKASVQACTDVYRESKLDLYTVEHTYRKGGRKLTARYTLPQVDARIGQYERDLQEAKDRRLSAEVISNRENWLSYWQGKRLELLGKMKKEVLM